VQRRCCRRDRPVGRSVLRGPKAHHAPGSISTPKSLGPPRPGVGVAGLSTLLQTGYDLVKSRQVDGTAKRSPATGGTRRANPPEADKS